MRHLLLFVASIAITVASSGVAYAGNTISGVIKDRNGQGIGRALLSVTPGHIQLVTDEDGSFLLEYLRDGEGKRTKLQKKTDYSIEIFKPGFHVERKTFFYKRGEVMLDDIMLIEATIEVDDDGNMLDPTLYAEPTQSSGANYEGE